MINEKNLSYIPNHFTWSSLISTLISYCFLCSNKWDPVKSWALSILHSDPRVGPKLQLFPFLPLPQPGSVPPLPRTYQIHPSFYDFFFTLDNSSGLFTVYFVCIEYSLLMYPYSYSNITLPVKSSSFVSASSGSLFKHHISGEVFLVHSF